MKWSKGRILAVVAIAGVASGGLTAFLLSGSSTDEVGLLMDEGNLPDQTATDWVTYADHVVVATATDDEERDPVELSGGSGFIDRTITFHVDEVLWSRPKPAEPMPDTFTLGATGWGYDDGDPDNRTLWAVQNSPRGETGHTYILALEWQPARCDEGDEPEPATWRYLGSDAFIPYDGDEIGAGEMEGHEQTVEDAQATAVPNDPNFSFEDSLLGKSADDLAQALEAATPVKPEQFGPDESQFSCD